MARRKSPRPFRPQLAAFEDRLTPAFTAIPAAAVVVAPDDGGVPVVRVVNPTTGADVDTVTAYEDVFRGGVHAALGDVTGDGVRDIAIAPGKGGGPRVRLVDGATGSTLADFFVYESTYTGGVYVALGDVNGDGRDDLVTGTGVGGGPRVRVLDGKTLGRTVLKDYFAYEDTFRGGVQVAAGDLDGDGKDDVITGTGVGGGPRVSVFDATDDRLVKNFFAYEDSFRGGVQVAAGDLDGDGKDDVIAGSGVGGGPVVRAVSGRDDRRLAEFFADDSSFRGGVRVDAVDANGDGTDDLVCHTRHGNDDSVRVFDGRTQGFTRSVTRRVDDNPSANDRTEGGVTTTPAPAGAPVKVEGTVTAVDAAAGTVTISAQGGTTVVARAAAGTEVEVNDRHTTLSAITVGQRGEALIGADGVAWKIEAESAGGGGDIGGDDDGTIDQGGGNDDDGAGDDSGGSGSGNSGGGSGATDTRVEGSVTAVDAAAGTVTIRTQGGSSVVVKARAGTKIERNDRETTLSTFRVGDRGEARVGADGFATKIEAAG